MNPVKPLLRAVDRYQQRRPWLAFPIAVWKKFGDDQAGSQAALIAYYGFLSLFPLLLVLVEVLSIVLRHDASLQTKVFNDATADFPTFRSQFRSIVDNSSSSSTGIALAVGIVLTFFGARGVATAAQNAFNQVWEVPLVRRPSGAKAALRSVGMIVVVGLGEVITFTVSGFAGGVGKAFTGVGAYIAATAVALLINVGLFWLGFRLATASEVDGKDLWLCSIISAVVWQILQNVGTEILTKDVGKSSYGVFSVVLGLLAWLYLQAQITLYSVEISVVRASKLWPRSMFPPPLTEADERAYAMYAQVQQRRKEQEIESRFPQPEPKSSRFRSRHAKTDS